jgi:hypothetical protein
MVVLAQEQLKMLWSELAAKIAAMTPEQQAMDCTIYDIDNDRYFDFNKLMFAEQGEFLAEGSPIIAFSELDQLIEE